MITGVVYEMRNAVNDTVYIGSTFDLKSRINHHFSSLKHDKHPNLALQIDFDLYGRGVFTISVLDTYTTRSKKWCEHVIRNLETYYICRNDKIYNIAINHDLRIMTCDRETLTPSEIDTARQLIRQWKSIKFIAEHLQLKLRVVSPIVKQLRKEIIPSPENDLQQNT